MSDLRTFVPPVYEGGSNNIKIYGAVALAAIVVVVGGITYAMGMWNAPPAQPTATQMSYSDAPPVPPAVPPQQAVAPAPVVPVAPPASVEMAPAQPTRHAPPVKAARTHVSAPAAIHRAETSPLIDPITPIESAPTIVPSTQTQTPPVQTAPELTPEQPAPVQPVQ